MQTHTSSAATVICPKCSERIEAHHVRTWVRKDPFGKSDAWDQYHVSCYGDVLKGKEAAHLAAVEAALHRIVAAYQAEAFMCTADFHPEGCQCLRCAVDNASALIGQNA